MLVAAAGIQVGRSEYNVTTQSMLIVWATEIAADRVSLSLVLMTFAVGLLMHACKSRTAGIFLGIIALSLCTMTATLAYYRAVEIEKTKLPIETVAGTGTGNSGGLKIAGLDAAAPSPDTTAPQAAREPDRLPACLAGLLAFLLSAGGIALAWGGFHLAGPGLVALAAFPAFVILGMLSLAVRLAAAVVEAAKAGIERVTEAWLSVRAPLVQIAKRLLPWVWKAEGADWQLAKADRTVSFTRHIGQREAAAARERRERQAESDRMERDIAFLATQQARDMESMSKALQTARDLMEANHQEGLREFFEILNQQRKNYLKDTIQDIFTRFKDRAARAPHQAVSMLFYPLERVWQIVGEPFRRREPEPPPETSTGSEDTNETKEEIHQ